MDKICDLRFMISEKTIALILKMMGFDVSNLEKDKIDRLLKEYMKQYFFNPHGINFTVLKVEIKDSQEKTLADYSKG